LFVLQIGYKELDFPAVTVCNLNRIRQSQINLGGDQFVGKIQAQADKIKKQKAGKAVGTKKVNFSLS
jgi:hypothetical protein